VGARPRHLVQLDHDIPLIECNHSFVYHTSILFRPIQTLSTSHLLPLNRRHNLPRILTVPKLQIPNALPRPCIQPSIRNRNRDARPDQCTLDMRWHIIAALRVMPVQALALLVLWHDAVQSIGHVGADIFVIVLVKRESAGCVLDEEVEETGFVRFYLGQRGRDVVGYEVGAAGAGGEGERFLEPVCLVVRK
jgi:hypothetical protein